MRWRDRRQSTNVEDRRGTGGRNMAIGGGLGLGTIVVVLLVLLLGGNPADVLQQLPLPGVETSQTSVELTAQDQELGQFVSVVLADTEDVWTQLFHEVGRTYSPPTMVLFTDWTESACGSANAAIGPFYCPTDKKVYIDLRFLQDLQAQLSAPGDFAMAYVIAHEVGHHVQQLLGTMDRVDAQLQNMSKSESNQLSIRLELQADFYAGVWAYYLKELNVLEAGDIEEALNAASAVGDDRIQKQTQGTIVPDSFTHGTSEQRVRWFTKGWETGDMNQGDTFSSERL
jgi:predicted metalloprotease